MTCIWRRKSENLDLNELLEKGWDYKGHEESKKTKDGFGKTSGDISKMGFTQEKAQAFNPSSFFSVGELKGDFRQGSKVQGPMNSSNLIGWKL
jgi:hypothetical protein